MSSRTVSLILVVHLAACGGADDASKAPPPPADRTAPSAITTRDPAPAPPTASTGALAGVDTATVPVMVGGEEDFDACGSLDEATTPLEVRSGPGNQYAVVDRLDRGARVTACENAGDGGWAGVVYSGEPEPDCGVSSPIPERQPYKGACKSGWVPAAGLTVLAG